MRRSVGASATPRLALAIVLVCFGLGCARPMAAPEETSAAESGALPARALACRPSFPDESGWYGGDAAYSIPLPIAGDQTSLWLFGDSFVQRSERPAGREYPFVHNSIALSRCDEAGHWQFDPHWNRDPPDAPRAFFEPEMDAPWVERAIAETGGAPYYWPFGGFVHRDTLFIGLVRVGRAEPRGPFELPFRLLGTDLARIENFRAPPEQWIIRISTLSSAPDAIPASAFVVDEGHLYAFGFIDPGDGRSPRFLARLDLSALDAWQADLSDALETLVENGAWEAGFDPRRARILMSDDASEMSVHFDPQLERWLSVYSDPTPNEPGAEHGAVWLRRASRLEGPWSPRQLLFTIPETRRAKDGPVDPNLFCYAAKAHPEYSAPGRLLVTYVCNLFARTRTEIPGILQRLREAGDLYRPNSVELALPPP